MPRKNRNAKATGHQQRHGPSCPCKPCRVHRSNLIKRGKKPS